MTDRDVEERIRKEKANSVKKTLLSVVGVAIGLAIVGKTAGEHGVVQWGGIICIAIVVAVLVAIYNKIKEN